MHIHAFSPFEIWFGAHKQKISPTQLLKQLKDEGLGSMPGTAAEILDREVRQQLTRNKLSADAWVETIMAAHRIGLRTTSTIMYGHVDGPRHWAGHIDLLRSIQKKTGGSKLRTFVDLAGELAANGHKVLVFSQFVDFLQLLKRGLERAGLALQYLDGATPATERTRRVAAFQAGEGDVFLISLKAGGFGLNLTAADYVIIADPWWNPAAEDQAMGRAHRIGQQRPVTVYRLISAGTIEERIVELHKDKRALADGLLDADEDAASGIGAPLPDVDELVGLLRR